MSCCLILILLFNSLCFAKISAIPEEADIGTLIEGKTKEVVFFLKNYGKKPVTVENVIPDCDCTSVISYTARISPKEEGKVIVKIDTAGLSGKIRKKILVITDDPESSEIPLFITGKVISPIDVTPKRVYLVGKKDSLIKAEVEIKGNFRKLKIEPASSLDIRSIRFYVKKVNEKEYRIKFLKFPSDDESYTGTLKLKTNYPEKPYIIIPIIGIFFD